MSQHPDPHQSQAEPRPAVEWVRSLSAYRDADPWRSSFELAVTVGPFLLLWALAWWSMSISYWLTFTISLINAGFLLRLFCIQHDCGHGAFFSNRTLSDWLGRVISLVTLTPYDVWRRTHSIHHSASGHLGRRGIGDVHTLTVAEYRARTPLQQFLYRVYRNPIVLFGLGPGYMFFVEHRIPLSLMGQARAWVSAMATNVAIIAWVAVVVYFGGLAPILLIFLPSTLLAATAGVWLFYVQHQFETTQWEPEENWQLHECALHGSSHYVLPPVLQWISANIGIHHVHHLYARIPFYRLPEVLRDHVDLAQGNRMTIRESLINARLHLWDEDTKRLVSFTGAKAL